MSANPSHFNISADLVNTSDGTELWGSQYARKLSDITQVQGDITRDISNRLRIHLSGAAEQRVGKAGTTNPEAYRLYLEGRQLWHGRTPDGLKKSIDLYQQAIAADPNYALAYTGLADTYNVIPSYGAITSKQAQMLADAASRKAVEPTTIFLKRIRRAFTLVNMFRFSESEPEFRRALELNPNNATAHYFYAFGCLNPTNRLDQSLAEFRTALSLAPLSSIVNSNYAWVLMAARHYGESLTEFQKVLQRDPNFFPAHYKLSILHAAQGRFQEAVNELAKSGFAKPISVTPDAKGYLQLMLTEQGADRAADISIAAAIAGDRDRALENLEKAYADGDNALLISIRLPVFDPFHSDPRFKSLMLRLGLPE